MEKTLKQLQHGHWIFYEVVHHILAAHKKKQAGKKKQKEMKKYFSIAMYSTTRKLWCKG